MPYTTPNRTKAGQGRRLKHRPLLSDDELTALLSKAPGAFVPKVRVLIQEYESLVEQLKSAARDADAKEYKAILKQIEEKRFLLDLYT